MDKLLDEKPNNDPLLNLNEIQVLHARTNFNNSEGGMVFNNDSVMVLLQRTIEDGDETGFNMANEAGQFSGYEFRLMYGNRNLVARELVQETIDNKKWNIYNLEMITKKERKQEFEVKIDPSNPNGYFFMYDIGYESTYLDENEKAITYCYRTVDPNNDYRKTNTIRWLSDKEYNNCIVPEKNRLPTRYEYPHNRNFYKNNP
jgi:hypothetical protein